MPEDIRSRILAVQEKSGFIPNVFLVLAHRPDEFRAFFAYHDALMERPGNLTKAELISENPYRLARDIRGIGFRTADQIAAKLGIEKTALIRVRAGVSFALAEAMDDGHCGLPAEELVPLAQKLLEVTGSKINDRSALLSTHPLQVDPGVSNAPKPVAPP
jgi:hypothetical protein